MRHAEKLDLYLSVLEAANRLHNTFNIILERYTRNAHEYLKNNVHSLVRIIRSYYYGHEIELMRDEIGGRLYTNLIRMEHEGIIKMERGKHDTIKIKILDEDKFNKEIFRLIEDIIYINPYLVLEGQII